MVFASYVVFLLTFSVQCLYYISYPVLYSSIIFWNFDLFEIPEARNNHKFWWCCLLEVWRKQFVWWPLLRNNVICSFVTFRMVLLNLMNDSIVKRIQHAHNNNRDTIMFIGTIGNKISKISRIAKHSASNNTQPAIRYVRR